MDADGRVTIGAGSLPGYEAPSGEGRLAILRFEILAAGQTNLDVTEALTVDADQNSTNVGGGGVVVDAGGETKVMHFGFVPMVVTRGR